jgi:membrane fusion protein (multidrug efflux system)
MVYLVVGGIAKLVPVTLGMRQPGQVEITSGVKDGDEVVVAGQLKLHDGAKVKPQPMTKPVATPAAAPAAPSAD